MMFRLERWKAGTLLGTWIAYWVTLVGVSIGPGLLAAWRLTRQPGARGSMSASVDNSRLLIDVNNAAAATGPWHFNASIGAVLAWVAIPPLALWLVWLVSRPRRGALPPVEAAMLGGPNDAMTSPGERATVERVERRS